MDLNLLKEFKDFSIWINSLKELPNEYWMVPIKQGKWSIGEIVSHIEAWDHFVFEERIAYFLNNTPLPDKRVDVEAINKEAAKRAKSGIAKNDLIDEVVDCRIKVAEQLEQLPDVTWEKRIQLSTKMITLSEYISGLVEHDQHHKQQIKSFLMKNGIVGTVK